MAAHAARQTARSAHESPAWSNPRGPKRRISAFAFLLPFRFCEPSLARTYEKIPKYAATGDATRSSAVERIVLEGTDNRQHSAPRISAAFEAISTAQLVLVCAASSQVSRLPIWRSHLPPRQFFENRHPSGAIERGATIALMAKFKPAKGKRKVPPVPKSGLPCVILVISAMALLLFFVFLVMKYANG
jgi:hypothetical protein